ncbi:hypothetical protein [Anaerococcus sp. AGMB09787]|uniref:hypothetical protein n=1 Tax=Anaerococcus sp. AGMB09787 TaxID=2922869 RepID=UPI001FB04262|nr:hypothetical protein [Anaerococcus sp. AGMB09787]
MAKISVNLPDDLEKEIRKLSEETDQNLTTVCITLLRKGLNQKDDSIDPEEYKRLHKEYEKVKKDFEEERKERLKVLDDYKNFNTQLLDLMKADRILQIDKKQPKKSLGQRIKIFFLGEKTEE